MVEQFRLLPFEEWEKVAEGRMRASLIRRQCLYFLDSIFNRRWAILSPGRKRRSASGVDFTMSNSRGGRSRLELWDLRERYAPGPSAPSAPLECCHDQLSIRADTHDIVARNKNCKE